LEKSGNAEQAPGKFEYKKTKGRSRGFEEGGKG